MERFEISNTVYLGRNPKPREASRRASRHYQIPQVTGVSVSMGSGRGSIRSRGSQARVKSWFVEQRKIYPHVFT
jgi:hypothetical protein